MPGGPAELAGLQVKNVILNIDGRPMDNLPLLSFSLYARNAGDRLRVTVLRGREQVVLDVPVIDRPHDVDRLADLVNPEQSVIRQLGILGLAIDDQVGPMLSSLRVPSGVIVAARTRDAHAADVSLSAGDVIHSVNGLAVSTLSDLREALDALKPHSPVVLQVEREGILIFVAFELD